MFKSWGISVVIYIEITSEPKETKQDEEEGSTEENLYFGSEEKELLH